ncbi:hypothetical protein RhiirA4_416479 [Rhizophagus irregularis]|uniref:Uncharacterized protein n=1 Tax=Rhizophagus irregularis TaxID=588596 RepID=A0A2I1G3M1_9GLOM|nr:hypothetical protein RhiirA4_416479 [Rhizophagus irregularis]
MSDNTKLKPALHYNPILSCIVRSTLSVEQIKINVYENIQPIINDIKIKKAIAKDMHAYILQIPLLNFPSVVIALIANNGTDNILTITSFHQELLTQIASQLNLPILSIRSDGAIVEFKAQVAIQLYSTNERLTFKNNKLGVDFSCPICCNLGRQDDGAAYHVFCSENLQNCHKAHDTEEDMQGLFVYLFITEYVTNMSEKYPNFISVSKNFLADQSFAIFVSLAESIVLLMHGSEACEHFFGMACQINSDFNYSELLQLVPKISQCTKALRTKNVTLEKKNQFVMVTILTTILEILIQANGFRPENLKMRINFSLELRNEDRSNPILIKF